MAQPAKACAVSLAVIGGSGLYRLDETASVETYDIATPYAAQPLALTLERTAAGPVWFLPRHGAAHSIAPHLINYRANIWALREAGVHTIIAVNAVGGISERMPAGALVVPDQLIDYSWGREHTFFTSGHALDKHVDFTSPYDGALGLLLHQAGQRLGIPVQQGAVYACTQGPRLETAAEIRKLRRDECDIVGMTGMPEAALARELGLRYACLALVVNRAAGLGADRVTHDEIQGHLNTGMAKVRAILLAALPLLAAQKSP